MLDPNEHELLLRLMQQLAINTESTTATLIEAWREHPYFDFINKLAAWEHQVPKQGLLEEFIDTILFLQKQNEPIINQLRNKVHQEGLNETEWSNLQKILQERHIKKTENPVK